MTDLEKKILEVLRLDGTAKRVPDVIKYVKAADASARAMQVKAAIMDLLVSGKVEFMLGGAVRALDARCICRGTLTPEEKEQPYVVQGVYRGCPTTTSSAYLKEEAEERAKEWTAREEAALASWIARRDDESAEPKIRAHYAGLVKYAEEHGLKTYVVMPCRSWHGDRIAHPGYMDRRRAAVLAEHPEYASKR